MFLKLTYNTKGEGSEIYINPLHIITINQGDKCTFLTTIEGEKVPVKKTALNIMGKISQMGENGWFKSPGTSMVYSKKLNKEK